MLTNCAGRIFPRLHLSRRLKLPKLAAMNATTFRILPPAPAVPARHAPRRSFVTSPVMRFDPHDQVRERIESALQFILLACLVFALGTFLASL